MVQKKKSKKKIKAIANSIADDIYEYVEHNKNGIYCQDVKEGNVRNVIIVLITGDHIHPTKKNDIQKDWKRVPKDILLDKLSRREQIVSDLSTDIIESLIANGNFSDAVAISESTENKVFFLANSRESLVNTIEEMIANDLLEGVSDKGVWKIPDGLLFLYGSDTSHFQFDSF